MLNWQRTLIPSMDYEFELVRNMTSLTGLFFICAVAVLVSGCAVNYSSPATGAEHLWGLGQMQFMTNRVGTNLVAVTTGTRVPGLCLELGRNHFGLALGYLVREKADVAEASRLAETEPPSGHSPAALASEEYPSQHAIAHPLILA